MTENKPSAEQGFQEALKDAILIIQKLAPHCKSVEALIEVCQLGLNNDAQSAFLMSLVASKK